MNPYTNTTFWSFFGELSRRLLLLLTGSPVSGGLASDELQLLVLLCLSVSSALVGSFLVLRRMTMVANSISHTILVGIVVAYLLIGSLDISALLLAALLTGLGTTFLTELFTRQIQLQEDASTGLVFSALFALGIVLVTLFTRNSHIGLEVVMGNVDALHRSDLLLAGAMLGANLLLFTLFFKEFSLTTFDPGLARSLGFPPNFFNYLLMLFVSGTSVSAFRAVGVIMALAFLVVPALTARLLTHRLPSLLLWAAAIGAMASLLGVALARHLLTVYRLPISTGGLVVCCLAFLFFVVAGGSLVVRRRRALTLSASSV